MQQQKKSALAGLTERNSPFVDTKTQRVFKNAANLALRGKTYDALHLDRFLDSQFGEKALGTNITSTYVSQLKRQGNEDSLMGPLAEGTIKGDHSLSNAYDDSQHA